MRYSLEEEFQIVKDKYKNWKIEYMKGLGSMSSADWDLIPMDDKYLIGIVDDGKLQDTLKLLFSEDADARKKWLTDEPL